MAARIASPAWLDKWRQATANCRVNQELGRTTAGRTDGNRSEYRPWAEEDRSDPPEGGTPNERQALEIRLRQTALQPPPTWYRRDIRDPAPVCFAGNYVPLQPSPLWVDEKSLPYPGTPCYNKAGVAGWPFWARQPGKWKGDEVSGVCAHATRKRRGVSYCAPIIFAVLTVALPAAHGDDVQKVVDEVSVERFKACEVALENMGLGLYGGPGYDQDCRNRDGWADGATLGNQEARLFLIDQLTTLRLCVRVQGAYANVVADWPGIVKPQEIYVVCAHYDTPFKGECPGGDDNASGTAGVLEAARVLTQHRFRSTLRFIAFNAEEEWMKGSEDYVKALPPDANVVGVINLDMILRPAWDSNSQAPLDLEVETLNVPRCTAWMQTFVAAAAEYVPALVIDPNSHYPPSWDAGDHGSFIRAGYPALNAIENSPDDIWFKGSNIYYHTGQDASDALANDPNSPSGITYDYEFGTNVVKAAVATLASCAGLIPPADPNTGAPLADPNSNEASASLADAPFDTGSGCVTSRGSQDNVALAFPREFLFLFGRGVI